MNVIQYRLSLSLVAVTWLGAGCGASQMHSEEVIAEFQDERANPYSFNRSIAYTLLRTDQPMEASRVIRRLLELEPEDPEAHTLLGHAYLDLGQYPLAERALKAALKFEQEYAPAQALLGVLFDTQGRHPEAQRWHWKAIAQAPDNPGYRNNLGFSYYLSGRYRRAIHAYTASLAQDVSQRRVHNNLAFAYAKAGDLAKAEEHFALAGPPAQASNNLGYVYEGREELDRAHEYYHLALRQDPRLLPARKNLARLSARLGRPMPDVPIPELRGEALPPPVAADAAPAPSSPGPSAAALELSTIAPQTPDPEISP